MTEQTERLLQLAEFLDALPEEQFDISSWYSSKGVGLKKTGRPHVGCGTVACAMGWAPAVFPELKYHARSYSFELNGELCGGFAAAMELFDLTCMQSVHLFDAESYSLRQKPKTRPADVATRIYRFVRTRECA